MPIGHHWFMQWLGTEQVPSHWLNQWWPSSVTHTCITRPQCFKVSHYNDVIMSAIISQITSLTIVYSTIYSGTEQRKHGSSASLAFVWGIHRWPVNSPYKRPVTWKMLPFDDVIMACDMDTTLVNNEINAGVGSDIFFQHIFLFPVLSVRHIQILTQELGPISHIYFHILPEIDIYILFIMYLD